MSIKLTILCENSVGKPFGLIGEHGFACHVQTPSGNYLFDTGQGQTLINNAKTLGINLSEIDAVLISHGHYDHTGGLPLVFEGDKEINVYAHPDIFTTRYWDIEDQRRYLGIPYRREYLESLGARFHLQREMVEVGPGVYLTGEIPRKSPFELGDPQQISITADGKIHQPDPLKDDLSMVIKSPKGLILLLGCAHAGLVNIINEVQEKFAGEHIYAVIGGTHLAFAGEEQFQETLSIFNRLHIEHIGVSHCTGLPKATQLASNLGDRFFFANVGTVFMV